ncbi:MAG: hypothetical protein ABR898_10385 [Terracidiphilus sp.]|jgi:hypothetical protein
MACLTVWLNGKLIAGWRSGYNGWRLKLVPFVIMGNVNQLTIRLDHPLDSSRIERQGARPYVGSRES